MKKIIPHWPAALTWLVFVFVSLPSITYLFDRWISTPEINHGIVVPFISGYLIWKHKYHHRATTALSWLGIIPLIGGLLLLVAAIWADIGLLYGLSLPISIIGLCWLLYGYDWVRARAFPLVFLFLAIPWPDFLIDKLSVPMQHSSAALSELVLRLLLPIQREGVHLWTPRFEAQVAVACSGIRSLMAITTVAALIAASAPIKRGWQLVLFASSIPVAYFVNILRIVLVFVIGHYYDSRFALTIFHDNEGLILICFTGAGLSALRHAMVTRLTVPAVTDEQSSSITTPPTWPRIAVGLVLLAAAYGTISAAEATSSRTRTVHINTMDVPYTIGDWIVTDETPLPEEAMELLIPDAVVSRTYRNTAGDHVDVLAIYGHHKISFHSPSYCLPGDGWSIQREYEIQVKVAHSSIPFRVMLMEKNTSRILVIYSYIQPDDACVGLIRHNLRLAQKRLQHKVAMGASVRLVLPVNSGSDSDLSKVLPLCSAVTTIVQAQLNEHPSTNR